MQYALRLFYGHRIFNSVQNHNVDGVLFVCEDCFLQYYSSNVTLGDFQAEQARIPQRASNSYIDHVCQKIRRDIRRGIQCIQIKHVVCMTILFVILVCFVRSRIIRSNRIDQMVREIRSDSGNVVTVEATEAVRLPEDYGNQAVITGVHMPLTVGDTAESAGALCDMNSNTVWIGVSNALAQSFMLEYEESKINKVVIRNGYKDLYSGLFEIEVRFDNGEYQSCKLPDKFSEYILYVESEKVSSAVELTVKSVYGGENGHLAIRDIGVYAE